MPCVVWLVGFGVILEIRKIILKLNGKNLDSQEQGSLLIRCQNRLSESFRKVLVEESYGKSRHRSQCGNSLTPWEEDRFLSGAGATGRLFWKKIKLNFSLTPHQIC